jgi:hypothetical protein
MPIVAKKYKPNLSSLMHLCDSNYLLLLKLCADKMAQGEQRQFSISNQLSYQITINEVTRYTSLITIEQLSSASASSLQQLLHPSMIIRLYHDARMAEVISSQDIQQVKPRYDYPNQHMHQPDEKQQISQFLKEWLQLCLMHGHVNHTVFQP